jgi:hypothetical protein
MKIAAHAFGLDGVQPFMLTPKPSVANGGVDIGASRKHFETPFALMYRAPRNLPVESWEPAV